MTEFFWSGLRFADDEPMTPRHRDEALGVLFMQSLNPPDAPSTHESRDIADMLKRVTGLKDDDVAALAARLTPSRVPATIAPAQEP